MRLNATTPDIDFDIAIVGGGLAGSAAAAMIGRSSLTACLIDPRRDYHADFRCEALTQGQVDLLTKVGLLEGLIPSMTASRGLWIARRGKIVERRESCLYGVSYQRMVNQLREQRSSRISLIEGNVMQVQNGPARQTLTLADGRTISARLVVIAVGTNARLRRGLGITQTEISPTHSISLGFDVNPRSRDTFEFPALTYYSDSTSQRAAYITLFPTSGGMRANLFVYRSAQDPWLKQFQRSPHETLNALMPNLMNVVGPYEVSSAVQIRPVDLYEVSKFTQDGIVLIGDAFANSCPAAGTGCDKVLVDVERLCNHHLPRCFEDEGMTAAKIQSFYNDPVKNARDAQSRTHAFYTRAFAVDDSVKWRVMRVANGIAHYMIGRYPSLARWIMRARHALRSHTAASKTAKDLAYPRDTGSEQHQPDQHIEAARTVASPYPGNDVLAENLPKAVNG
jgi:2-polyprenyl-6-methoxyphenol hydroxylase-like FAD-dependent oxidoreductase